MLGDTLYLIILTFPENICKQLNIINMCEQRGGFVLNCPHLVLIGIIRVNRLRVAGDTGLAV